MQETSHKAFPPAVHGAKCVLAHAKEAVDTPALAILRYVSPVFLHLRHVG
jgi:hypothetical protein